jgi:aromatic ring-cleaving dioxygenase
MPAEDEMREPIEIAGYHAHVYFDAGTREAAERVREGLAKTFSVEIGRWHEQPVGPHPKAMYQVAFAPDQFAGVVPWLMLNRAGLSVLVHPRTGDEVADHGTNPLWLGEQLPIDIEFLKQHAGE